jgi:hypothetical protein
LRFCASFVASNADAQRGSSARVTVTWTVAGAGAGFGIGLWAGLTAFDDAVNSDRKVWTGAVAGAAIGGVAGYLIGRSRRSRSAPAVPLQSSAITRKAIGYHGFDWSRARQRSIAGWRNQPLADGVEHLGDRLGQLPWDACLDERRDVLGRRNCDDLQRPALYQTPALNLYQTLRQLRHLRIKIICVIESTSSHYLRIPSSAAGDRRRSPASSASPCATTR